MHVAFWTALAILRARDRAELHLLQAKPHHNSKRDTLMALKAESGRWSTLREVDWVDVDTSSTGFARWPVRMQSTTPANSSVLYLDPHVSPCLLATVMRPWLCCATLGSIEVPVLLVSKLQKVM